MKRKGFLYIMVIVLGFLLGFTNVEGKLDVLLEKNGERKLKTYDGWLTNLDLARNDQSKVMRAIVARVGLGANTKEEAIYLTSTKDDEGDKINSKNDYEIIIEKPIPVNAFWSLTIYGDDDYLVDNEFDKYGLSSFQGLTYNADSTTITVLLSKEKPEQSENWIPLPKDAQDLTVTLRCYNPKEEMLTNLDNVNLPKIQKRGDQ